MWKVQSRLELAQKSHLRLIEAFKFLRWCIRFRPNSRKWGQNENNLEIKIKLRNKQSKKSCKIFKTFGKEV